MKCLVTIVCCLGLASAFAAQGAPKQAEKAIRARYAEVDRAYMKKDIDTIQGLFSQDCKFKVIGEGQTIKTPYFLQGTKALFKNRDIVSCKTDVKSLRQTTDGIVTEVMWSGMSKKIGSSEAPTGTRQKIIDTWKETSKGWTVVHRFIEH